MSPAGATWDIPGRDFYSCCTVSWVQPGCCLAGRLCLFTNEPSAVPGAPAPVAHRSWGGGAVSLLGVHLLTVSGSFYTLLHNSQRQPAHKYTRTRQGSNYRVSKQQAFGSVRGCGPVSTLRCTLSQAAQHAKPGCSFEARTKRPCVDFNCSAGRCRQLAP